MDPFRDPPADSLAAARLHVQALTDCGLSREALLRALLENYGDGDDATPATMDPGFPQQAALPGPPSVHHHAKRGHRSNANTRLSVSTTSSKSSGRASIRSMATSMSSVSSHGGIGGDMAAPPLPTPPAPPSKSSNRGGSKPQGAYWCTFCDVAFQRKFDWKRHEDEFHERYKRYPCPNCNRIFWGANTFNQHHKNAHGCTTCPHADRVVRYTQKKTAWACGFCGGFLASRDRYFDHIARHYEDGCNKAHWNHSLVIYGLLHQPSISQAWKELDAELYGHLPRNQQPMLEWDSKMTGHAQGFLEGESPGKLQDLLEFFSEGRDDPKFLARLAHDSATIRVRDEIQPSAAPVPSPAPSISRPISEPPKQNTPSLHESPLVKHMSTPQPNPPSPPMYDDMPFPKKQRSLAPLPAVFSKNPFFDAPPLPQQQPPQPQQQQPQQQPQPQQPQPHDQQPIPQQAPQGLLSPFSPMMATTPGGFYDLTVTHVHPHMQLMSQMPPQQQQQQQQQHQQLQHPQLQQQQPPQPHLLSPINVYDDWSSLAGTVVDESVFAGAMALGWGQAAAHGAHGHGHHAGTGE